VVKDKDWSNLFSFGPRFRLRDIVLLMKGGLLAKSKQEQLAVEGAPLRVNAQNRTGLALLCLNYHSKAYQSCS